MKNSNNTLLTLLLLLFFLEACSGEDRPKLCMPEHLYLSITSHAISPPLVTEFSLNTQGNYWLYRSVEEFDTIRGVLERNKLSVLIKSSREVYLPPQEEIVSDAGIYKIKLICSDSNQRTATYEGLSTLPIKTKNFVSSIERLIQEIGTEHQAVSPPPK